MSTLYLVRHGAAGSRGESWPDDALRPLTPAGRARIRTIARHLMAIGETAPVVLTSPLARAMDTARVLSDAWTPAPTVSVLDELAPGHTAAVTLAALEKRNAPSRVALVGHEPGLGQFAAWLIGAHRPVPFKKGGVARIDVRSPVIPGGGQLVWLATPKILRARD